MWNWIVGLALASLSIAASGEAVAATPSKNESLYQRLGGKKKTDQIAKEFVKTLSEDDRLLENPTLKEVAAKADRSKVQSRLSDHICKGTGGPCKPKGPVMEGIPKGAKISAIEWFYVMQDANTALDKSGVPAKEKSELLALLLKQKK